MAEVELTAVPEERIVTAVFRGINRRRRCTGESGGAYYTGMPSCLNMSSDEFPCAVVRAPRVTVRDEDGDGNARELLPAALRSAVCRADGKIVWLCADGTILCGTRHWAPANGILSGSAKHLLEYGAGLYAPVQDNDGFGDGIFVANADDTYLTRARAVMSCPFHISLTDGSGTAITAATEKPESPAEGDYWYDEGAGLYRYDGSTWQAVPVYHTKLTPAEGAVLSYFKAQDVVRIRGADSGSDIRIDANLTAVSTSPENPYLLADTWITPTAGDETVDLTVERRVPVLDYAVQHDNRIWGCRYGLQEGQFVNEIYACALGDPTNWYSLKGTEEDSFAASFGEPGAWTGAAVVGDHVVFFKDRCMVTVYGDAPSNYSVVMTPCDGIEDGSWRSAVLINGALYYHSSAGVMRLSAGSLPIQISDDIAVKDVWENAVAGTDGRKYYIQMTDTRTRQTSIYAYDTVTADWYKEDRVENLVNMVRFRHGLLAISRNDTADRHGAAAVYISPPGDASGKIPERLYLCRDEAGAIVFPDEDYGSETRLVQEAETSVSWFMETGDFGQSLMDYKRVKLLCMRAWTAPGTRYRIEIMYDEEGVWHPLEHTRTRGAVSGTDRVEYRLRRCDSYRMRISGAGGMCLYSIAATMEQAGDRGYGNA